MIYASNFYIITPVASDSLNINPYATDSDWIVSQAAVAAEQGAVAGAQVVAGGGGSALIIISSKWLNLF